jgi:hypothetical protein
MDCGKIRKRKRLKNPRHRLLVAAPKQIELPQIRLKLQGRRHASAFAGI